MMPRVPVMKSTVEAFDLESAWGKALQAAVCGRCDWSYLLLQGDLPPRCPHCFQAALTPLDEQLARLPYTHPPELVLPFAASAESIATNIQNFARGIWFAPPDLTPGNIKARLTRLYLPMWLVDADIQAAWQAEAGFDYEVVSHQDRYEENRGGWVSQELRERRIRWEPRLGRLTRSYQNIPAPAQDDDAQITRLLGKYDLQKAEAYRSEALDGSAVRLPNRDPQDAWSEAAAAFQSAAAEECRMAARADHIRQFSWQPEFQNQNWTLLLLPLFASYYLDDEQTPQPVLVHGRSGQINAPRRASMRRAQRASLVTLAAAIGLFLLSLLLMAAATLAPPLMRLGTIGLVLALLLGLAAILPVALVAWFNHQQKS